MTTRIEFADVARDLRSGSQPVREAVIRDPNTRDIILEALDLLAGGTPKGSRPMRRNSRGAESNG